MIGAIIGDIVGSRFEWHNIKTKKFEFIDAEKYFDIVCEFKARYQAKEAE